MLRCVCGPPVCWTSTTFTAGVGVAVDLVAGAYEDAYDAAYIVSADGDYVPAVEQAQRLGKTVYAASPAGCFALKNVCRAYIRLDYQWFLDKGCFR